jgi:hypothetical protein
LNPMAPVIGVFCYFGLGCFFHFCVSSEIQDLGVIWSSPHEMSYISNIPQSADTIQHNFYIMNQPLLHTYRELW